MGKINLTPRLALIAETVRASLLCLKKNETTVADIGTDHAKLPLYLINNCVCSRAYAADINQGPLYIAAENIGKYLQYPGRIKTILSDGLKNVPKDYDVVVIAGMGGELIADIIEKGSPCEEAYLVLNPMTASEELRRYLYENGYKIIAENAVSEKDKIYTVICVRKTNEKFAFESIDLYISKALIKNGATDAVVSYIDSQIKRQGKIIEGKKISDSYDHIYDEASSLKKSMERMRSELLQAE